MNKDQVKGISAKKKAVIVNPVPDNPKLQFVSKDEFLRLRAIEKKAVQAAEDAKNKVLEEAGIDTTPEVVKESASQKKIELLRRQLANAESKLAETPTSKAWKTKVKSLSEELEVAEAEE
jgi:hypothetical protein